MTTHEIFFLVQTYKIKKSRKFCTKTKQKFYVTYLNKRHIHGNKCGFCFVLPYIYWCNNAHIAEESMWGSECVFIFACFVYNIRNQLKRQRHAKYCCCSVLRNYIKTDLSRIFILGGTFNTLWLINSHVDVWKLIRELFIIICLLIIVTFCFCSVLLRIFVNNDCLYFCVL